MALSTGSTLGAYEVSSLLGSGGMGEVYRARDTKLGRSVAIKVLPEAFAFDAERVARFEREAKVLASLNHPHIAALHGMEEVGGQHFLIMELVEGETLADRLGRGAMPVVEALQIAIQIADALEAAHEKGIVHRDLKPANIKITPDDKVKVLDFGLARAMEAEVGAGNVTHSPTVSLMATQAGVILGTAAYMSPEQAKGLPADYRSDVFSFGCVLYEMLAGRQAFQGDTAADILASVIVRDADVATLRKDLNSRLVDLVTRCLQKNPKRRWQAVGDLRAELESFAAGPQGVAGAAAAVMPPRPVWRRAMPAAIAALVASALTVAVASYLRPAPPALAVTRFPFVLGNGQVLSSSEFQMLDISADGSQMAYAASGRLYVRSMSDLEARPVSGTDGAPANPVFSPDGRSIAFWARQAIQRIAVTGGAVVTVGPADVPFGMSWGPDGILFGQSGKGIMRLSPNGGKPETLVTISGEGQAYGPRMLPDGDHVLFTLATGTDIDRWDRARVIVQSLQSGERKVLIEGGSDARYVPTGHLTYALGGTIFAVPFDLGRLEVTDGPVSIVEGVRRSIGAVLGAANASFSGSGSLVYIPGPAGGSSSQQNIAVMDRKGAVELLKLPPGSYQYPRVSPDGKRIAFGTDDGREAVIWIYDLAGASSMRRLTFGGKNRFPLWSADGERVAFQSDREGDLAIFWQRADGTGPAERLTKPDQGTSHIPESWSPNGQHFLFTVLKGSDASLWAFSLRDKSAAAFGDVQSRGNHTASAFSPDGRWVAYGSNDTGGVGDNKVYIQPFPATGAKFQISKTGENGHDPLWSPDGRELFYVPLVGQFVAVTVAVQPTFSFTNPVAVPRAFSVAAPTQPRTFDITPEGKIIGVVASGQIPSGTPAGSEIRVVLNWFEELKARVPVP